MNRRQALRWGCAHCAILAGWAGAQTPASTSPASAAAGDAASGAVGPIGPDWSPPPRFTRPDAGTDEGGLWALMDREETRLRRSPLRLREGTLEAYLAEVTRRLAGEHAPDVRVYAVRTPFFNATMAPNGMMQVWSGLLLRVENEAQLAAVLGHEVGHYLRRHSVERLRDMRSRAAFGQIIGLFGLVGLVGQLATLAGALAYSREHEREADLIGASLLRRHGYAAGESARLWQNLLDELRAVPGADPTQNSVLFATHPAIDERIGTLATVTAGSEGHTREGEYRAQLAPLRRSLLDDELKRGRLPETLVLLDRLVAREPASAELLHYRGEARRLDGAQAGLPLALADFQAALQAHQPLPATQRSLGFVYRTLQQKEPARAAWTEYLRLAPDAPDAALIRQSLTEL